MPRFLDTSVIVRYLALDPQHLAERAARLIEGDLDVAVTDTALMETSHVLRTIYAVPREGRIDLLIGLLQRENVSVWALDKAVVVEALLKCRPSGRVSVPDALIWAAARCTAPSEVYAFDQRFPEDGVTVVEPE